MLRYVLKWAVMPLLLAVGQSGVFYSPRHSLSFPLDDLATIDIAQITRTIDADLASIKPYYGLVRTAQSTYFGVDIAPIAKKHSLRLFLGVDFGQTSPDSNDSYEDQVAAAISAVLTYPGTVQAIIVGNDNVSPYGSATAQDITARVTDLKMRLEAATGVAVPVGTSQRADAWLSAESDLKSLASAVDIIGVETYPYLDPDYSSSSPLDQLESTWVDLAARYPEEKLIITATGYPTGSENPPVRVALNQENAKVYFQAFTGSTFAGIWAAFFDLRLDDPLTRIGMPQVKSFGLVTDAGTAKDLLPTLELETGALTMFIPGVCYSPFHNSAYPLNGGSAALLGGAMDEDFKLMSRHFSVVRTYYSSYLGYQVVRYAAKYNVGLYLGVFMTREAWYQFQIDDAVGAALSYPSTIKAILVGNENVIPCGPYKADEIIASINTIRSRIQRGSGRYVPIGTVQRATEWLNPNLRADMLRLAASCDVIGVNIYPFFDGNYDARNPLGLLDAIWNQLLAIYPASKLRLTEIGFPTGGAAPSFAPRNIPSLANSFQFYNAFQNWSPKAGGGEAFWYSMFDLRPDDTTQSADLEKHFGFFTSITRLPKLANYPLLRQDLPAPQPTSLPVPTPPLAPVPTPTTTTGQRGPQGVAYSPFHADEYPNDLKNIGAAISLDLQLIRTRFSAIRTEYSNFYGIDVAPFAAAVGLKLMLGIGMTREAWYEDQVQSALSAIKYFPSTVLAVTVGSENAYRGTSFTANEIGAAIRAVRDRIAQAKATAVRVGTVQRATEWLNPALRTDMIRLGQDCDVIGVTLSLYDTDIVNSPDAVTATLNRWWNDLSAIYPSSKLQLMNIGFPSSGAASTKGNVAGVDGAVAFYNAFRASSWGLSTAVPTWTADFFDDKATSISPTKSYGFFTPQRQPKAVNFPLLRTG
ncbi:hypothetical protein DYB32_004513 [Aphanomyces invadans]|uniref:glucan endo-1,3-beta-D-glucosidase n=1 Tax=Aphanomyces invadans TaxID=157072 RepID=A0A3R6Y9J1_9STRA|nr:hypothetical protein DYB32_004513 [Aphanomyces invadans]